MSILDWGPLSRIRRNHGLEHAALQILARRQPGRRLAGYSDARGFWVIGSVRTEDLRAAVNEALGRLEGGESRLAVHPNCGTNFAVSGLMAGSAAWLAMLGVKGNFRKHLEHWPVVITLVTLVLILTHPLGPLVQERLTTDGRPRGMRVVGIILRGSGDIPVHRILTEG
jgi:hypothetical protein